MGLDLHLARPATPAEVAEGYSRGWYYCADSEACPHPQWSYGGFSRFRERLAKAEGFDLAAMRGFGGQVGWDEVSTGIEPLLNHSDCDGEMTPDECAATWQRLREIVETWPQSDLDYDHDRISGARLADAMRIAAERGLTLAFR